MYPSLRQLPIRRGSKRLFRSHLAGDIKNSRQPLSQRRGPGIVQALNAMASSNRVHSINDWMFGLVNVVQPQE